MKRFGLILLALVFLVILGGGIVLANWNIPASSAKIEKPVPDEKMPK